MSLEKVIEGVKERHPEWFGGLSIQKETKAPAKPVPVPLDNRQKAAGERDEEPWPEDNECPF